MNSELEFASSRNWDDEFYEDELDLLQSEADSQLQLPKIEIPNIAGETNLLIFGGLFLHALIHEYLEKLTEVRVIELGSIINESKEKKIPIFGIKKGTTEKMEIIFVLISESEIPSERSFYFTKHLFDIFTPQKVLVLDRIVQQNEIELQMKRSSLRTIYSHEKFNFLDNYADRLDPPNFIEGISASIFSYSARRDIPTAIVAVLDAGLLSPATLEAFEKILFQVLPFILEEASQLKNLFTLNLQTSNILKNTYSSLTKSVNSKSTTSLLYL